MKKSSEMHLVGDVIDQVPGRAARAAYAKQALQDTKIGHNHYISSMAKICVRFAIGNGKQPKG